MTKNARIVLASAAALFLGDPARATLERLSVVVDDKRRPAVEAYKVGPVYYLNAKEAGEIYSSQVYWYPASGKVQMSFRGKPLRFLVGSKTAEAADRKFPLEEAVIIRTGMAYVPIGLFLSKTFAAWSGMEAQLDRAARLLIIDRASPAPAKPKAVKAAPAPAAAAARLQPAAQRAAGKPRLVIDAGHGGKDTGASGARGLLEKDVNLLAALELAKIAGREGDFEVLVTRPDDQFVTLGERSKMANEFNADFFVSLHCNASSKRKDSGFEIYFLSEKASDPEAERLAEFENSVIELEEQSGAEGQAIPVLVALAKAEHLNESSELAGRLTRALKRKVDLFDRGVKQADFYVLRGTNAPAVLVEMGFLTNGGDEPRLGSSRFRRRIVEGLYAGLAEYAEAEGWLER